MEDGEPDKKKKKIEAEEPDYKAFIEEVYEILHKKSMDEINGKEAVARLKNVMEKYREHYTLEKLANHLKVMIIMQDCYR